GLSENPSPSKDSTKADSHSSSRSNTGLKVLLICLGAIALVLFSLKKMMILKSSLDFGIEKFS
ncbi:hypothetical protein BHE74_00044848, partial [Ensete ventricosum]